MTAPVTVCADRSPTGHRAVQWAAAEARRRDASLEVVITDAGTDDGPVFAKALAAVRRAAPGLPVLGQVVGSAAPAALREMSTRSAAVVVPATAPELRAIVAESYCPVVIVPDGSPPADADRRPVVLGAAPWTGEEVFDLAFRAAAERGAPLLAVRIWNDPRIDLGRLLPARVTRWDATEERARRELEISLTAWRLAYPEVEVESMVVEDRAADFLIALSYRAGLLVLGRSVRGALLAGIAGSPVATLGRASRCPVLVVPAEGPPRWTWLPSRGRGLAGTAR